MKYLLIALTALMLAGCNGVDRLINGKQSEAAPPIDYPTHFVGTYHGAATVDGVAGPQRTLWLSDYLTANAEIPSEFGGFPAGTLVHMEGPDPLHHLVLTATVTGACPGTMRMEADIVDGLLIATFSGETCTGPHSGSGTFQ